MRRPRDSQRLKRRGEKERERRKNRGGEKGEGENDALLKSYVGEV